MPTIMERVDYSTGVPRIPFLRTETSDKEFYELHAGSTFPRIGIWLDKRFCSCGKELGLPNTTASYLENSNLKRILDYSCPDCALKDTVNVCSLKGIPRLIVDEEAVRCETCYKYPAVCASGYCVYLAVLSDKALEVKVGVTKCKNVKKRAAEGGYAAMAILLPPERDSLSLPEAQFIEKNLIKGMRIGFEKNIFVVDEAFKRDIGFVGKDLTKQQTIAALLSSPSKQLESMMTSIASKVISEAKKRGNVFGFSVVKRLALLEIVDIPEITNGDIDEKELLSIDPTNITTIRRKQMQGRPVRIVPNMNSIVAVKGPCVMLRSSEKCYCFRLSRHAV